MLTQEQITKLESLAADTAKATGIKRCDVGFCVSVGAQIETNRWHCGIGEPGESVYGFSDAGPDVAASEAILKFNETKAARVAELESQLAALKGS